MFKALLIALFLVASATSATAVDLAGPLHPANPLSPFSPLSPLGPLRNPPKQPGAQASSPTPPRHLDETGLTIMAIEIIFGSMLAGAIYALNSRE